MAVHWSARPVVVWRKSHFRMTAHYCGIGPVARAPVFFDFAGHDEAVAPGPLVPLPGH